MLLKLFEQLVYSVIAFGVVVAVNGVVFVKDFEHFVYCFFVGALWSGADDEIFDSVAHKSSYLVEGSFGKSEFFKGEIHAVFKVDKSIENRAVQIEYCKRMFHFNHLSVQTYLKILFLSVSAENLPFADTEPGKQRLPLVGAQFLFGVHRGHKNGSETVKSFLLVGKAL